MHALWLLQGHPEGDMLKLLHDFVTLLVTVSDQISFNSTQLLHDVTMVLIVSWNGQLIAAVIDHRKPTVSQTCCLGVCVCVCSCSSARWFLLVACYFPLKRKRLESNLRISSSSTGLPITIWWMPQLCAQKTSCVSLCKLLCAGLGRWIMLE